MSLVKEITIYDIAQRLNISAATVSRGLKEHPAISSATKEKINAAAATELISLLNGKTDAANQQKHYLLEHKLIIRNSSARDLHSDSTNPNL